MRAVYRNPKELATAVKDLVDLFQDDLMTYEKLSEKIKRISESNEDRFFKNGKLDNKSTKSFTAVANSFGFLYTALIFGSFYLYNLIIFCFIYKIIIQFKDFFNI